MSSIRSVLFDLDATLLDHDAAARSAVLEMHSAYGSPLGPDSGVVMAKWIELTELHYERYLARKIGFLDQRRERARDFFGGNISDGEVDLRFAFYLEVYEREWKLFPDVIPCLDDLRSFPLGLITNGDGSQQNDKVLKMGLVPRLKTVVVSGDVGMRKPDKGIFHLACNRLGVSPSEAMFVGDRIKDDAIGALGAGLQAVWLDRKSTGTVVPSGIRVINSLSQLPGLVL